MSKNDDQYLYQWACLIVDTYEQTAIKRGTREGAMIMAKGPLFAVDDMLSGSRKILTSFSNKANTDATSRSGASVEVSYEQGGSTRGDCKNVLDPSRDFVGKEINTPSVGIEVDIDPVELAVTQWNEAAEKLGLSDLDIDASKIKEYLDECLDCNLQIDFDWQLQPVNLLGPLNLLLDDVEGIVDGFASRLDPFNLLRDLCGTLEGFRPFCIAPDLINLLLSFQMLLKKYITFGLEVMIDWTAVVGMLLKGILDALVSMLQQITLALLAPLDCAITALQSVDKLLETSIDTANTAIASGQAFSDTIKGIPGLAGSVDTEVSGYVNFEKETDSSEKGFKNLFTTNENSLFNFDVSQGQGAGTDVPIGFKLGAYDTLATRMKDPTFKYASPLQQAIMAVREAREYVASLFENVLYSFKSLNALMSGNIGIQLNNAGAIMLILDLISLVKMLIGLAGRGSPDNWCSMLSENPDLLKSFFGSSYPHLDIAARGDVLQISAGPWEGSVVIDSSCAGNRSSETSTLLNQWIDDLERGMK